VRQLTGKAQDKWPFFDRNWKTMPSAVVKNLSVGEDLAAVNTSDLDTLDGNNGVRHASTVQSPGTHPGKFSPTAPKTSLMLQR
jgi:hypothetical protein